jgi:hypothetical protein
MDEKRTKRGDTSAAAAALLSIFKDEQIEQATKSANEAIRRDQKNCIEHYVNIGGSDGDRLASLQDIKERREEELREAIEAINALTSVPQSQRSDDEEQDESYREDSQEDGAEDEEVDAEEEAGGGGAKRKKAANKTAEKKTKRVAKLMDMTDEAQLRLLARHPADRLRALYYQ